MILKERLAVVLATVLLAIFASTLVGAGRLWLRGLMYNLAPAMGAAFYAVAFWAQPHPDAADLIAGLLFEITVLTLFFRLLIRLKQDVLLIRVEDATSVLKWGMVLQLLVALPNMTTDGFGVFSDSSRIDYLSASWLAKYLTYAGLLISTVQAAFLASIVTSRGYIGVVGWAAVATNFALSVVAGSKGGVFLWLLSIASLIDYGRARIPTYRIMLVSLSVVGAVLLSSLIAADFLNLEFGEFIDLAISRFFLNNDARALALDIRTSQSADFSLFSESFRSLGNLLGLAPRNEPLGVVLYREGLSITNGNGANTSFMALATYYFPIGYALLPAALGMLGAVFIAGLARLSTWLVIRPACRVMVNSIWLACLLTYTQDFLAFQVLLPISILAVFAIWVYRPYFYDVTTLLQDGRN